MKTVTKDHDGHVTNALFLCQTAQLEKRAEQQALLRRAFLTMPINSTKPVLGNTASMRAKFAEGASQSSAPAAPADDLSVCTASGGTGKPKTVEHRNEILEDKEEKGKKKLERAKLKYMVSGTKPAPNSGNVAKTKTAYAASSSEANEKLPTTKPAPINKTISSVPEEEEEGLPAKEAHLRYDLD